MAAPRKRSARKATKKKPARRKAPARKATRKSSARSARRKTVPARRASRTKRAPKGRSTPTPESIARKIVRATSGDPSRIKLEDFYAESCSSVEPGGRPPVVGLDALRAKLDWWRSIVKRQSWKSRNVWIKANTICIEWHAEVELQDGRKVDLDEIAIHEVRGGKIVAERYYYDPSLFAPSQQTSAAVTGGGPAQVVPEELPPNIPPAGSPPLDPMDL